MLGLSKQRKELRQGIRSISKEIDSGMARVFVDHGFQWDGTKNIWLTRARASFVVGGGPVFDLRGRSGISQFIGLQSGTLSGDPSFDSFFSVQTRDPAHTFSALTPRVRWLMASAFSDAHLVSDGHMLTLVREAEFGRERDSEIAVELVSEIAHYRIQAIRAMFGLPHVRKQAMAGPWDERNLPSCVVNLEVPVTLSPTCELTGNVATNASAYCGNATQPFTAYLDQDGDWSVIAANDNVPKLTKTSPEFGPATVVCDGNAVRLWWTKLVSKKEKLMQGARLVAALANSHRGGFFR